MREGREMGLMVPETPSAFASLGLVFSGILDQCQNYEDRSDPIQ